MYFNQFTKTLNPNVVENIRVYGYLIQKLDNNTVLVNGQTTEFTDLEEARKYIKTQKYSAKLEEEISQELYEEISENNIAKIIKEHHKDIKVTDTLIESYIDLASSNIFTVDPIVQEIRKLNKLDVIVENKIHYELNDGSIVAINQTTQDNLNNLLQNQKEVIEYMRESKDNFLYVLEKIGN